jgi:hypothetical protein
MKQIILCLILFMILIGCTGIIPGQNKDTIQIPDIHKGTQGLEINYLNGMPPVEIFENQLFEIGLEITNKGATDIQNGIYNIAINEQFLDLIDEKMNRINIKGKSIYQPLGGKEQIRLKVRSNQLGGQITKQSTTIIANACYEYSTKATVITCIDTQELKQETKACKIQSHRVGGGQGGPVGVISVEPKMLPHENPDRIKPVYIIEIQNLGTGQIIDSNLVYDACTGRSLDKKEYDVVFVNAMLSNDVLNCEPSPIKLRAKENKILCELNQGLDKNRGNYQSPLSIELDYGYMQTLPKTITINKKLY